MCVSQALSDTSHHRKSPVIRAATRAGRHCNGHQACSCSQTKPCMPKRQHSTVIAYVTAMLLGLAVLSPVKIASTLGCCAADSCCHSVVESLEAETAVPPHSAHTHACEQATVQQQDGVRRSWCSGEARCAGVCWHTARTDLVMIDGKGAMPCNVSQRLRSRKGSFLLSASQCTHTHTHTPLMACRQAL